MKKVAISLFAIIFFVLIFCTLLAPSVENEMRTLVAVQKISEKMVMRNHSVPAMALRWPDGQEKLYHIVEGKGWNTGDRIAELSPTAYRVEREEDFFDPTIIRVLRAEVYPGKKYDIIVAASRQPVDGDEVFVVEEFSQREDTYIIYYPDGAKEMDAYPISYNVLAKSDQASMLIPTKAYTPYLEQKVVNTLQDLQAETLRVYSVADVTQFYQMIPAVFMLAMVLLLGVFLWIYSCVMVAKEDSPLLLCRNVILGAGLLWAVPTAVSRIDLPASLLPSSNILDVAHYRNEFRQIFAALKSLNSDLFRQEQIQCGQLCVRYLAMALAIMVLLVAIDLVTKKILKIRSRNR